SASHAPAEVHALPAAPYLCAHRTAEAPPSLEPSGTDGTFDEPFHVDLECIVGVRDLLPSGDHLVALVVLQRGLVELECIVEEILARREHGLLHVLRNGFSERAQCHHVLAESAAIQIRIRRASLPSLDEVAALRPIPLGTGEKAVGGERR